MNRTSFKNFALTLLASSALAACASNPPMTAKPMTQSGNLEKVASFGHQVTGVTVASDGRTFVNFPRWTEDAPVSVAELNKDGSTTPYPNAEWNAWRNTNKNDVTPSDHFVCVQAVVADTHGNLWVVDAGAPANDRIIPGAPKLVKINLATNSVSKIIPLDEKAAPQGSYLNDIRISPDGRTGYLTDSGKGAIIIVNLETGKARRLLENTQSVKLEKNVTVHADGAELRRPDGRQPEFNADGLALSADGKNLYWQALTGHTLYRVPTDALRDEKLPANLLAQQVEAVGDNGVADGLLMDKQDMLYVTSPEDNSVKIRDGVAQPQIWVQDAALRWPDTLSQGPDGAIYVTTSHIQDSAWFKLGADKAVKTELWKITK